MSTDAQEIRAAPSLSARQRCGGTRTAVVTALSRRRLLRRCVRDGHGFGDDERQRDTAADPVSVRPPPQDAVVRGSENRPRNDESPAGEGAADGVPAADDGAALGASTPSAEAGETGRMSPTTLPSVPTAEPGVRPLALLTSNGRSRAVLGVTASGGDLPLTGFPLRLVALLGLVLLASGLATLRRASANANACPPGRR